VLLLDPSGHYRQREVTAHQRKQRSKASFIIIIIIICIFIVQFTTYPHSKLNKLPEVPNDCHAGERLNLHQRLYRNRKGSILAHE
jgi:hypothetical protein